MPEKEKTGVAPRGRKGGRGRAERDSLVIEYCKYVQNLVGRMINSMSLPQDLFDELVSAGNLGLVEAAERFDPSSGVAFKSYAFHRIRGAVIDSIRRSSDLSGRAYRYSKALRAAEELRQDMVEGGAGSWNMAANPEERLAAVLEYAARGALAYRLSMADAQEEIERMPAQNGTPESQLGEREERRRLRDIVAALPAKERAVIEGFYFKEMSFAEIASENNDISKSWVSRLHTRALERIKMNYENCDEDSR